MRLRVAVATGHTRGDARTNIQQHAARLSHTHTHTHTLIHTHPHTLSYTHTHTHTHSYTHIQVPSVLTGCNLQQLLCPVCVCVVHTHGRGRVAEVVSREIKSALLPERCPAM